MNVVEVVEPRSIRLQTAIRASIFFSLLPLKFSVVFATVDQIVGNAKVRIMQIRIHHGNEDQAVSQMGEASDDDDGTKENHVLRHISRHCHHVCHLVTLRAH